MTDIGTVIDGKYEILKEIGRGGMSVVYLAMDKHLNKQWAVKEIRKQSNGKNDEIIINSLLVEANMMKRLDHPALPRIVDIIDNGVTIYVVMDYIEGESLDVILKEYGAQPEDLVTNWAVQVCDALSYLHAQHPPIIYRDMKPANLMLKPEGNIKIIDFGIAREYKEQNLADTTVLGTKGYAPPEQYSGQTDPRSDIFALGMTMHHLLTGVDPRNGGRHVPVRQWNPELSEGIELIIEKCVQPAPENRYQNCADLMYDLQNSKFMTNDYRKKQKRKLYAFIAAAGLSLIMLAGGFACRQISTNLNNNEYYVLVDKTNDSVEDFQKAIDIYPERPEAYYRMLETFEETGFGRKELEYFQAAYSKNKEALKEASPENYVGINYKCGLMCINMYGNTEQEQEWATRVGKARPFFNEVHNMEGIMFDKRKIAECYYDICYFYKEMFNSADIKEPSKDDYNKLLSQIEQGVDAIEDAGGYDKICFYNSVINLLRDQATIMFDTNVEEERVLKVFDDVCNEAESLNSLRRDISRQLRDEIVNNREQFRQQIELEYDNTHVRAETRKDG